MIEVIARAVHSFFHPKIVQRIERWQPVDAIPISEAIGCENCRRITRRTRYGVCGVCGSNSIMKVEMVGENYGKKVSA